MKRKKVSIVMLFLFLVFLFRGNVLAATPIYHDIPAYQEKNLFETERIKVSGIAVEEITGSTVTALEKPVRFEIFNSTKQETEYEIVSSNGQLPELSLIKNHNYIIFAKDSEYSMDNVYIWMRGNVPVNIKEIGDINNPSYDYPEVKSLRLQKRGSYEEDPDQDKRVMISLPVQCGEATIYNVTIRLVSAFETVETTSGNRGYLRTTLLEDVPYIVEVEHDKYGIETFPIAVKDKSEYGAGKYTYDFSSCKLVESIQLVNKEEIHKNDTIITSQSGKMTAGGMNFKDFLLLDRKLDVKLDLEVKDYEVLSIILVNPHRWEIGRFPVGNYQITLNEDINRRINNIYCLEGESNLKKITFDRTEQKVSFTLDSMSMQPIVVEYEEKKITLKAPASAAAKLSGGHDDVKFSWSKSAGADGYFVYFKKSTAKAWTKAGSTTALAYTKKNLTDNVTYNFKVVPYLEVNGEKISDDTKYKVANVTTKKNIKAPSTVKAVLSGGHDDVKVSWKKSSGAAGYYVYYKKNATSSYSKYKTVTGTSVTIKSLTDGTKYNFKVVPYYKNGTTKVKGYYSKTASVYTLKKLAVPKVAKASSKKIKVSWTNIYGESGYQISRSTKKTGTSIVSTYSTTTGKAKTLNVAKGKKYYYKVRAYKTVNGKKIYGPWSNVVAYKLK